MNLKNKIFKESIWSFAAKGSTLILFFLINIYLARKLGREVYGTWSYLFSLLTIISLISYFGINASTKRYVAQHNNTDKVRGVIKSAVKIRFYFSLFFCMLVLALYNQIAQIIGRPEFSYLILLAVPMIFISGFVEFLKEIFLGMHRVKYNFIVNSLEYGLKLILVIIFFNFSIKISNILSSYILALFLTSVVGFYLLYFNFYKSYNKSFEDYKKDIFKYSFPLFFVSIGFIVATEIDTMMIGLMLGDSEVGIYSVAKQIIVKIPHISTAIAIGVMPIFARITRENKEKLKKLFYKLIMINTIIMAIIILIILIFSPYFIPLLYGEEYLGSVAPLRVLTVYLLCFSTSVFLSSFLDYQGKAKKRAINLIIAIILNILLNLLLIPKYGATGSAFATSVSYLPYIFFNWLEVNRTFKD